MVCPTLAAAPSNPRLASCERAVPPAVSQPQPGGCWMSSGGPRLHTPARSCTCACTLSGEKEGAYAMICKHSMPAIVQIPYTLPPRQLNDMICHAKSAGRFGSQRCTCPLQDHKRKIVQGLMQIQLLWARTYSSSGLDMHMACGITCASVVLTLHSTNTRQT